MIFLLGKVEECNLKVNKPCSKYILRHRKGAFSVWQSIPNRALSSVAIPEAVLYQLALWQLSAVFAALYHLDLTHRRRVLKH